MCLPIRLPAHVFFTIMKFHNNEIHSNERTPHPICTAKGVNEAGRTIFTQKLKPHEPIPPMKHALFQHAKRVVITANYIIGHSHYRTKLPCCHLLTVDGYGMKD